MQGLLPVASSVTCCRHSRQGHYIDLNAAAVDNRQVVSCQLPATRVAQGPDGGVGGEHLCLPPHVHVALRSFSSIVVAVVVVVVVVVE